MTGAVYKESRMSLSYGDRPYILFDYILFYMGVYILIEGYGISTAIREHLTFKVRKYTSIDVRPQKENNELLWKRSKQIGLGKSMCFL